MDYWTEKYKRLRNQRQAMLQKLEGIDPKILGKRPNEHSWSIDEILRHQIGSEVRYIHQAIDKSIPQSELVVPAQWVGNILFRLEEKNHPPLNTILLEIKKIENVSHKLLEEIDENGLKVQVKAPWGQMVPVSYMLNHFYDHDIQHQGQIHYLITLLNGPPEFVKPDDNVNYG